MERAWGGNRTRDVRASGEDLGLFNLIQWASERVKGRLRMRATI
jgi:hypothetical protein